MHELAPIPFRRSLDIDWGGLGNASLRLAADDGLGAMLLKGGRFCEFESFVARELLPTAPEPARVHRQGDVTWLWQGPREWLLVSESLDGRALAERCATKIGSLTAAAIDVSDRLLVLELSGPEALALVTKGTSLDPALLSPRACCRTRFAGLHATLFRPADAPTYGLIVDRATRVHLHAWLRKVLGA